MYAVPVQALPDASVAVTRTTSEVAVVSITGRATEGVAKVFAAFA